VQRQQLLVSLLMARGDFGAAVKVLESMRPEGIWSGYLRYNLAIALIRAGEGDRGLGLLRNLGKGKGGDAERRALRDRANLTLAHLLLRNKHPEEAQAVLARVHLTGPLSSRALLAAGAAAAAAGRYDQALVPWRELQVRSPADPAVQASLVAYPRALGALGDEVGAVHLYRQAIDICATEIDHLNQGKAAVASGQVVEAIATEGTEEMAWLWQSAMVSVAPYLLDLAVSHHFHNAVEGYRDLHRMASRLARWSTTIDALDEMVATRRESYDQRLPTVQEGFQHADLEAIRTARDGAVCRFAAIEASGQPRDLATPREAALWQRLKQVATRIAVLPPAEAAPLRHKNDLLLGLLSWQVDKGYEERLWQVRKGLGELDREIATAEMGRASLLAAWTVAPATFQGFDERIATLRGRLRDLRARVTAATQTQEKYLDAQLIAVLDAHRQRLGSVRAEARLAIAHLYDEAASAEVEP